MKNFREEDPSPIKQLIHLPITSTASFGIHICGSSKKRALKPRGPCVCERDSYDEPVCR